MCLTPYPDERTCEIWATIVDRCRRAGEPIQAVDAWIASGARQWACPLVTTDIGDYAAEDDLDVVPIPVSWRQFGATRVSRQLAHPRNFMSYA